MSHPTSGRLVLFDPEISAEGERSMTGKSTHTIRTIWRNTRPIVTTAKTQSKRPTRADQSQPALRPQAEQEADRWVAAMMFAHYNG